MNRTFSPEAFGTLRSSRGRDTDTAVCPSCQELIIQRSPSASNAWTAAPTCTRSRTQTLWDLCVFLMQPDGDDNQKYFTTDHVRVSEILELTWSSNWFRLIVMKIPGINELLDESSIDRDCFRGFLKTSSRNEWKKTKWLRPIEKIFRSVKFENFCTTWVGTSIGDLNFRLDYELTELV